MKKRTISIPIINDDEKYCYRFQEKKHVIFYVKQVFLQFSFYCLIDFVEYDDG